MTKVNMLEAKTNLSKLVEEVESGRQPEIIIARNGKPAARLVPIEQPQRQLGLAEGEYGEFGEDWFQEFQALDEVIWKGWKDKVISPPLKSARAKKKSVA